MSSINSNTLRFRTHLQTADILVSAISERYLASGTVSDVSELRTNMQIFDLKWKWDWTYRKEEFINFMTSGVLTLAGNFCDPEKAYDFENYPDLPNWTVDSLKEKLGSDYLQYTPFADKDKFLVFICRILELCRVRRVPVYQNSSRPVFAGTKYRKVRTTPEKALDELKKAEFYSNDRKNTGSSIEFLQYNDGSGMLTATQYVCGFSAEYNSKLPCKVAFYGCAVKGACDEFAALGAKDANGEPVRENVWFCAGSPGEGDIFDNYVRKTLDFPDSELPDFIPDLEYGRVWKRGFELKKPENSDCVGYAVCDFSEHFNMEI